MKDKKCIYFIKKYNKSVLEIRIKVYQ